MRCYTNFNTACPFSNNLKNQSSVINLDKTVTNTITLSSRTSNNSPGFNGLEVKTTPLLKSSAALKLNQWVIRIKTIELIFIYFGLCAVLPLFITSACVPQLG